MKKPCVGLKIWDKVMKWVEFIKCLEFIKWFEFVKSLEFWVKNLNLCFKIWVKISIIFRQKPEFVILSVSEVSKNGKFSFNLCGFFAFLQRLKMTKRAQKRTNKAFKNFKKAQCPKKCLLWVKRWVKTMIKRKAIAKRWEKATKIREKTTMK